jgi:hypothetical protein
MNNRIYLDNCNFNDDPFAYTKWQGNLFENITIEELSKKTAGLGRIMLG